MAAATNTPASGRLRPLFAPGPVCLVWLGIVIGISIIEPPARFSAEEITYAVALDVGREVFGLLNRIELGLLLLIVVFAAVSSARRRTQVLIGALAVILALQSLWLLPELAGRSRILVGGGIVAPSHAHSAYAILEIAKMLCLLTIGLLSPRAAPGDGNEPGG